MRKTKDQINARAKVRLATERSWPSSRASPLQNSDQYIKFRVTLSKIKMLLQFYAI